VILKFIHIPSGFLSGRLPVATFSDAYKDFADDLFYPESVVKKS
jgi:hypothetical protein